MGGTYAGIIPKFNSDMIGTANEWCTVENYNDEEVIVNTVTPDQPQFWHGLFYLTKQQYLIIRGITFENAVFFGVYLEESATTIHNITIENCNFRNHTESAVKTYGTMEDIIVHDCDLYDVCNSYSSLAGQEGLSFGSVNRFQIYNNTINLCYKICIDAKGSSRNGAIYNNIINTTHNGSVTWPRERPGFDNYWLGGGITLDAYSSTTLHNISIYNNRIFGNKSGITISNELSGYSNNITVYNNIINCTDSNFPGLTIAESAGNNTKENISVLFNTFYGNQYSIGIYEKHENVFNLTIANNIIDNDGAGTGIYMKYDTTKYTVVNNLFNVSTSELWGVGAINASPGFVNPGTDFHLTASSDAIDAADEDYISSLYATVTDDFNGTSRPQGTGYDIGAYELNLGYDTTPPQISYISIVTSSPLDTNINYGWENISCTVTDNIAVDTVYLTIVGPNDVETTIEMTKIAGSNCYYYNSSWSDYGNYSYYIWAIDTSDNNEYSESFYFSLSPNWDINSDGSCGILDLILVSNHYNEIGSNGWIREDADNNGVINLLDMSLVSNHYDESWYT